MFYRTSQSGVCRTPPCLLYHVWHSSRLALCVHGIWVLWLTTYNVVKRLQMVWIAHSFVAHGEQTVLSVETFVCSVTLHTYRPFHRLVDCDQRSNTTTTRCSASNTSGTVVVLTFVGFVHGAIHWRANICLSSPVFRGTLKIANSHTTQKIPNPNTLAHLPQLSTNTTQAAWHVWKMERGEQC